MKAPRFWHLCLLTALITGYGAVASANDVGDLDGDGVADSLDCAPEDARLASPHRFYLDLDGDQSGDVAAPIDLCTVVPFPGTVAWHGDPDDADNERYPAPTARGPRRLGIDFTGAAEDGAFRSDLARELGSERARLELTWSLVESSPGVFDGPQASFLAALDSAYGAEGFEIGLTLDPIAGSGLTAPDDLRVAIVDGSARWDDAAVVDRFTALLDFVHASLPNASVRTLQIGSDVGHYYAVRSDAAFWTSYAAFFRAARDHARSLWGDELEVGINATARTLVNEPTRSVLHALNFWTDFVSVTYLARNEDFSVPEPEDVVAEMEAILALEPAKDYRFASVGYPSSPVNGSSELKQSQFVRAVFDVWDAHATRIRSLVFARLHDRSPEAAAAAAAGPDTGATPETIDQATAYFRTLGVRSHPGAGAPKAAYFTLRDVAFERGWWRVAPAETRSFLLGYSPHLYDHDPGGPIIEEVLDNLYATIESESDLVALHLDVGIPWVEALDDTFATSELPYSDHLKQVWTQHRDRLPPGMRLMMSLNPLGVPREDLAPYWGVGEGFYLDENFDPVGTGVVADYDNRLLPPPWNGLTFDAPEVKSAFLSYARRAIQFFEPEYLVLGVEVNLILEQAPERFPAYVSLLQHVYTNLKQDPAAQHVRLGVSLAAEFYLEDELGVHYLVDGIVDDTLRKRHLQALRDLLPYSDFVGLSVYPTKSRFGAYVTPASMFDHLFETFRAETDKPIAITETGFPSKPFRVQNLFFPAGDEKQERYVRLMFSELEKHAGVELVVNFGVRDSTPHMDKLRARSLEDPPFISPLLAEFFQFFEHIGTYSADGDPKPARSVFFDVFRLPITGDDPWVAPRALESPSGDVVVYAAVDPRGRLTYELRRNATSFIEPSPLGVSVDGVDLGLGVTHFDVTTGADVHESFPTRGSQSVAEVDFREHRLAVRRSGIGDLAYDVVFRVYDTGAAFRYVVPGSGPRAIVGEASGWTIPEGSLVWHQPNTANYESIFFWGISGGLGTTIGGPFTAVLPDGGGFLTLTEAELRNYSGMTFRADVGSRLVAAEFLDDSEWSVDGGSATPWRVAYATPDLDTLVSSAIVPSLASPHDPVLFPAGADTPWIRPGKAVWSFWTAFDSGFSYDIQRQYVDYAHEIGAEYVVIDAWWELGFPAAGKDQFERLAELAAYAKSDGRDVELWVWKNWWELLTQEQRTAFFGAVSDAGAVGVKIDNLLGDLNESFASVQLYEDILRDAAELELMINFHGVNKPTGLSRTFPNEITREGFAGLEVNGLAWEFGQFVPPEHNTVLPFTRFVVAPGDYTPVTFDERKIGDTTFTHQLATAGLFPSPMFHYADDPSRLLAQTDVLDVLRAIPVGWDETKVLEPSVIGELAALARRKGNEWFVFIVNGDAVDGRAISALDLSFLGAGSFEATVIRDATPTTFDRSHIGPVTGTDTLDVDLLPGGGFVARFEPAAETRTFRLSFTSIPPKNTDAGWQQLYGALGNHADMVTHSFQEGIPWNEALASSDYRDYPSGVQAIWDILLAADAAAIPDHDVYLMLNPIETARYDRLAPYWGDVGNLPLPEPWSSLPFNHPNVKTAYTNFVIAAIEAFAPDYVAIGIKSNILLAIRPDRWEAYKELNAHTYLTIKALYPDLPVFATVHYEHMIALHAESIQLLEDVGDFYPDVLENEVRQLLQHSDLFAVSTYPYMVANNPLMVGDELVPTYYDRFYAIGEETGKPLAIDQTGYISRDLFYEPLNFTLPGSETLQENFITFLLEEADAHDFRFVSNFVSVDYGTNYGTDPTTLTWAYAGLINEDGTFKPALGTWDAFLSREYAPGSVEPPPPPLEPLGGVTGTTVEDDAATFTLDSGGTARVELVDRDIVRVRFSVDGAFSGWTSGAIASTGLSDPNATVFDEEDSTFLVTDALSVIVNKQPFSVVALRPDGSVVSADAAAPIAFETASGLLFNRKIAQPGERYFGLGLRGGPLDRRGGQFAMRNTDWLGYRELDGPLYSSTPFFYGEHEGRFHGVFVDSPAVPIFDMDAAASGTIVLGAFQRELDYYVFAGPGPAEVANAYARLTGFAPLPPRWALGFHQSRFSYGSWADVRDVAQMFRDRAIPVDAIYLDLDYMNDLDWFSWDPVDFGDPFGNNQTLESMGVKRVNIVDPSIQPDDPVYGFLETSDFFLEDGAGEPVVSPIFEPFGDVAWVDYTNPQLGDYYVDRLKSFLDTGVSGIWNDLNEPAGNFMPDALYDFGGQKRGDLEARNLYALENLKLTHRAMLEKRPDERPFILTRSGYSGMQRYAANWSGDTLSTFDSLRVSIQMSLHLSLSGTVLFGHDIGGFLGTADPELYTRWMQFAAFTPFMRNHTASPDFTEPWAYGDPITDIVRDAIETRYRRMPYLYTLVENASRTAMPALRPLFFDFPEDPMTFERDSELMLGPDVLVAPVFVPGATTRTLYLPAGADWYDLATGERHPGGREITAAAPLTRIPTFVRAGAILPEGPVKQYVDEPVPPRVDVQLYPRGVDGEGSFELYEDDGISFGFERGESSRTRIRATELGSSWTVTIEPIELGWTPPARPWTLRFHDVSTAPAGVTLDGAAVSEVGAEADLDSVASGWFYRITDGILVVRLQQADLPAVVAVQQ